MGFFNKDKDATSVAGTLANDGDYTAHVVSANENGETPMSRAEFLKKKQADANSDSNRAKPGVLTMR